MSNKRKFDEMNTISPNIIKNDNLYDLSDYEDDQYFNNLYQYVKEYNKLPKNDPLRNLCIVCKEDMGYNNPRQLCGKIYCLNKT